MEIKILCPCGAKFKFDVEPVNARMPAPVNCPTCGADATEQANVIIQQTFPAAAAPEPVPVAPIAGGLRINRQHTAPAAPAPESDETSPPLHPGAFRPAASADQEKPESEFKKMLTTALVLGAIGFGAWQIGTKWYKRANLVAKVASAVGEMGVDQGEPEGAKNLWYEDCAILFIKHTNHLEVAEACKAFWKDKLHKKLTVSEGEQDEETPGEYALLPAHNGYVRILGAHEWPIPQHEALVQYLSQKFASLGFEWRSEHVADTYHFGVYDNGARKFHAQMDINMKSEDLDEVVKTEGNDYAIAHGFKPGKDGFKDFHVLHADKITQRLGMKLWDEKEGTELKGLLLKESGPAM